MVCELGIRRSAVEKAGCLPEMVTARICPELQNADAGRARPERLPARCFAGLRSFHDAASAEGAVENVVFPGRRPLGAQAAELAALVQDSERLGGSVVQEMSASKHWRFDLSTTPPP